MPLGQNKVLFLLKRVFKISKTLDVFHRAFLTFCFFNLDYILDIFKYV